MPKKCVAYGCNSTPSERISVHNFPVNPIYFKKWESFVKQKRQSWKASATSYLCSLHFEPSSYLDFKENEVKRSLGFNVV